MGEAGRTMSEIIASVQRVTDTIAEISVLISLAASALRCARLRTSLATTAKPRPCSPARAASIVALRASKFV